MDEGHMLKSLPLLASIVSLQGLNEQVVMLPAAGSASSEDVSANTVVKCPRNDLLSINLPIFRLTSRVVPLEIKSATSASAPGN